LKYSFQEKYKKALISLGCVVSFIVLYTIARRFFYPYELEWYEGTFLVHALHYLEGKELYAPPSASFVPFLYTPLFPMLSAVFMKLFGVSIPVMRAVPVLSTLGTSLVLFFLVKHITRNRFAAIISGLLFISTYKACDFYFDIARVDPLNLFCLAMGLFVIKTRRSYVGVFLGGIFLALSYFSKQSSMIFIGALCLSFLYEDRKKLLVFAAASLGSVFVVMSYLTYTSGGWAKYYITDVISSTYRINTAFVFKNWMPDLTVLLPALSMFLLCFVSLIFTDKKWKDRLFAPETAVIAACVTASFLMRNKWGGVRNVLMPLSFAGCLAGGLVLGKCEEQPAWLRNTLYCFVAVQFLLGVFNPKYQIPTKDDVLAGEQFIESIRRVKGKILMPYQTYYPYMAGKEYNLHAEPLRDITRIDKKNFPKDLFVNISQHKYEKIIVAYLGEGFLSDPILFRLIRKYYYESGRVFPEGDERFYTKTGMFVRPELVFLPK